MLRRLVRSLVAQKVTSFSENFPYFLPTEILSIWPRQGSQRSVSCVSNQQYRVVETSYWYPFQKHGEVILHIIAHIFFY